jgi:hypothetical protein
MSNMRSSFTQERHTKEKLALSQLISPRDTNILPAIIGWILNSGAARQQLRANLYAGTCLLYSSIMYFLDGVFPHMRIIIFVAKTKR